MENEHTITLQQYLNGVITNIPFGIFTVSKELDISMLNTNALKLFGISKKNLNDFIDEDYKNILINTPEVQETFENDILQNKERIFEMLRYPCGDRVLNIKCRAMLHGTLFIIEDCTVQAALEEELQHQASHDSLTDLINRQQLEKRLKNFGEKHCKNGMVGAVIFLDLDRFKPINDVAGHTAGDELLKNITLITQNILRERDTLARVGGDEFVILLENCPLPKAISIAEKIRKEIDEYIFTWEGEHFSIGISAGVAEVTSDLKDICEAISLADQACLIAKSEGRNRIHVADTSLQESANTKEEISWINVINDAIKNDNFVLYAQKIHPIDASKHNLHYELLIRLKDKEGKILSPAAFMPAAERYELMLKIDAWVVKNAFKVIKKDCAYSINLSGQTMSSPDFAEYIMELEKEYKINPSQITFEVTETMAIKHYNNTKKIMETLTDRGYSLSLDDFGTGLSSYEYLKKMPVQYLKIDGVFVKEIATDEVSRVMVKSINEIGHVMGLKTIAEFVENEDILEILKDIGVDYAQGYHIHKPESLSDI